MAKQTEQVAHAELVDGSQTTLHSHAGGGGLSYTEAWSLIACTLDSQWEELDLSGFGIPPYAVCEVVVYHYSANKEIEGGVRGVGSTLNRKFTLHEAEAGGGMFLTMCVKADVDSRIEVYSGDYAVLGFALVGYWS